MGFTAPGSQLPPYTPYTPPPTGLLLLPDPPPLSLLSAVAYFQLEVYIKLDLQRRFFMPSGLRA